MKPILLFSMVALVGCGRDNVAVDSGTPAGGGSAGGIAAAGGGPAGGSAGGNVGGGSTGGGSGAGGGCAALDWANCKRRADCAADYCDGCGNCDRKFEGCRGVNDPSMANCPKCPTLDCCRTAGDCGANGPCSTTKPPRCGQCIDTPSECANDGQCAATHICEPRPCSCEGNTYCTPDCRTTSCARGSFCSATTRRCVTATCDMTCPENFVCNDTTNGCQRRTCQNDSGCGAGFCVSGLCQERLGLCEGPQPP
jgi:hypothetical protein